MGRTAEEIVKEYQFARWDLKNFTRRSKELREEYVATLPKNQQLAIWLHSKLCHYSHTHVCECSFYLEIDDLRDDWTGCVHKKYLDMADAMLSLTSDVDLIKGIVEATVIFK